MWPYFFKKNYLIAFVNMSFFIIILLNKTVILKK